MMYALARAVVIVGTIAAFTIVAAPAQAATRTFYVDAAGGDDGASGLGEGEAWRSLDQVSRTTFAPGDRVLLRAGQRWTGQLWPKGSGTSAAPITIDRYGTGAKPRIDGAGEVGDAVRLFNQEHWTIRNLEVTNQVPVTGTPGENLRDLRGIHVGGDNSQTLDGFVIDAVDVHDVTGQVNWIGGSIADNAPGIRFQTGWDGSKKTGGIVFDTTVPDIHAPPANPTVLNDVVVQNSTIANTSFAGIVVKQYTGDGKNAQGETIATPTGWGTRTSPTDPKFRPHTNVVIRNNFITQDGTPYGCNGIYLTNVRGAVVEHNEVYRAGTSGIESYFADDVTFQFNEVHETRQKAGGADSNGIDPDKGTTRQVVQYNFLHGNGDGVLLCQFAFGDAIVRNNVIAGNSRYQVYLHSDRAATAKIYNNTIYNDRGDHLVYGYGSYLEASYELTNNILYSTRAGASLTTSPTIRYSGNLYGGAALGVPSGDTRAIVGDPWFAGAAPLESAHGLRVRSGSPAIDTGTAIADNGGRDYAGATLYNGQPDRGAFEYATAAGATTESVTGTVRTPAGAPVSGALVTVDGAPGTATTGADGRFAVTGVPFADGVTVTATRNGYLGQATTVDVRPGNVTTVDLTLASTSVVGTVSGRVLDQTAQPVAEAQVTVRDGEQVVGTTASAADGSFTVDGVPVGAGYTVRAEAPGFVAASRGGIDVQPATTTGAGTLLLTRPVPTYVTVDDFDGVPTGPLPDGTGGLAVSPTGGRVEVVGVPSDSDRSAKLTRTANSGSTSLARTFTPPLAGIVTVEANIMRDDPYVSGNNWFGVPYIRNANGQNAISVAFTRNTIVAYDGATTVTLAPYELGRWYRVTTVIDTVNQRFDLLVDGRVALDDAAFRTTMDAVAQVDFYANSSNYGSVHVDDFRVARGVGLPAGESAAQDSTLATLATSAGTLAPAFDPDVREYTLAVSPTTRQVTFTATAGNPEATVTIAGRGGASTSVPTAVGDTSVPITVDSEDGTANTTYTVTVRRPGPDLPQDGATERPAKAALSTTSGWRTGLRDGTYDVAVNLWWGVNASVLVLYENDVEIARRDLHPATPAAQHATIPVTGRPDGTYVYTAELWNQAGITETAPVTTSPTPIDVAFALLREARPADADGVMVRELQAVAARLSAAYSPTRRRL